VGHQEYQGFRASLGSLFL